ncbi:hypothetical protein N8987_02515 [Crocinitomix sp.]|nr:hypothetical protein [Crocinitomix sp.]
MHKQKLKITLLTLFILLLGFLRGYLFYNINWIYLTLVNGRMNGARKEFYFLLNWSPTQINSLKLGLTAFFVFTFFLLTYLIIKSSFKNNTFNKITMGCFVALITFSGLFFIIGKGFGIYTELYGIIRTLMGLAQSFMPLMILVLLFRFFPMRDMDSKTL